MDLLLDDLSGDLTYTNATWLASSGFTGTSFGETIQGHIESRPAKDDGEVVVFVEGRIAANDLYGWTGQPLLSRASGDLAYQTWVHLPFGASEGRKRVEAISDLQGVVLGPAGTSGEAGTFSLARLLVRADI